jgi:Glycosyl hydrolases family 8
MSKLSLFLALSLTLALMLGAMTNDVFAFGPTASKLPRVDDVRLDSALARTARGIFRSMIEPYADGLVHRPFSEEPGDAVSEGQAYGMMVALYANDEAVFNRIWDAAEKNMWSDEAKLYNWRWGAKGGIIGTGMATDADQDIALMLLFADSLAKKGKWKQHTSTRGAGYKERALEIIGTLWDKAVVDGKFLAPGAGWGGRDFVNPGYFSPASYKIFAQVDPSRNWKGVVDQCYQTLFLSPGAGKGLLPDWMTPGGAFFTGTLGYNAFRAGQSMYKDAIRVHWRLAMDWLWFGDARAKIWLDSATAFIGAPERANFYTMDGLVLPVTDTFTLGSGEKRSRREHSELTVGMWACAPFVTLGPEGAKPWSDKLLEFAAESRDLWGKPADTALPNRDGSMPNEAYFEQFLAWYGAAILAGRFSNIWEDLDDPNPALPLAWVTPFSATPEVVDFQVGPLRLAGAFNKPVNWVAQITHHATGAMWSHAARGANVAMDWHGFDATGKRFPQGWCKVSLTARGLAAVETWVWLSHHRDLRIDATWLLLDDFSGPTLQPYLGAWSTFNNSHLGGSAKVGSTALAGTGAGRHLAWAFDLGTGGYQFCGLEWLAGGQTGAGSVLNGSDKISYRAKADKRTVIDFHLVQSNIGDDNYFGKFDTVTTEWKVFEHSLADFRGRLGQRDGKADVEKGLGFRWHIQFDKNQGLFGGQGGAGQTGANPAGSIQIDDIRIGGNLAVMYTAPEAALPRTGNPPALGVKRPIDRVKAKARRGVLGKSRSTLVTPEGRFFKVSGRAE